MVSMAWRASTSETKMLTLTAALRRSEGSAESAGSLETAKGHLIEPIICIQIPSLTFWRNSLITRVFQPEEPILVNAY
jgi:hypothetical protein